MKNFITSVFSNQIIALFLSIGCGYIIGKIKIGAFRLGGISGTLFAAIGISLLGGNLDPQLKNMFFAIFLFAVGYDSGPQFFAAFNLKALKDILLAVFLAFTGLLTVLICAKLFSFDKGTAAGIAAGALTQSSMIGTANNALTALGGLSSTKLLQMQDNMLAGFAVTYLFGVFSAIIFSITFLEFFYNRSIRFDAQVKESELKFNESIKVTGPSENIRQPFVLLSFNKINISFACIHEIEKQFGSTVILKIKRDGKIVDANPNLYLLPDDSVLLFSRSDQSALLQQFFDRHIDNPKDDWGVKLVTKELVLTNKKYAELTLPEIIQLRDKNYRRGICLLGVTRKNRRLNLEDKSLIFKLGDVFEIYGLENEINHLINIAGEVANANKKTDYISVGFALTLGALLGLIHFNIAGISISIDVVGVLIVGLFFGWLHHNNNRFAHIPPATVHFMQDFGLTAFIAGIGLSAGKEAVYSFLHHGVEIFIAGLMVSFFPLLLTYLFGRYVLKYNNVAIFAGALTGARSADPAFGLVLEEAKNSVPTISFTISFAIANILLTLLGPIVVYLV